MRDYDESHSIGRRGLIQAGVVLLTSASIRPHSAFAEDESSSIRIGLVTDLHYADKPPAGSRHYRETLQKLAEAGSYFEESKPDFLVELGDLIDAADSVETEQRYLKTIDREFSSLCRDRHYVLGNHCVDTLKKREFLDGVGQEKSYYSFDRGGFHFVVLDSCFRSDGVAYERKNFKWTDANVPPAELEWLQADLEATKTPVVVFAHQRLDTPGQHGVRNNADVRKILESSGKVLAVFQGHSHKNELNQIRDIHYCTLVAMVEGSGANNSGYSLLDIEPDGTIRLLGFRQQNDYHWNHSG